MIQSTRSSIGIALFCTLTTLSAEPTAVTLGKGSYASEPPNPNPQAVAFLKGPDRLDPSLGNIPYPSNDIWSFGIWSNEKEKFAFGRPYLMPLAVAQTNAGFEVYLTNAFNQPRQAGPRRAPSSIRLWCRWQRARFSRESTALTSLWRLVHVLPLPG